MHYALYAILTGGDAFVADAEVPGDGGTDTGRVEDLPLDFAGLDHVGGQSLQEGLLPEFDSQRLHAAQEVSLEAFDPAELGGESAVVPGEGRPFRLLVQVSGLHVYVDREFPDGEIVSR